MNAHPEALSVGVTSAEIAWPIVLGLCIILMVFPFVFLIAAKTGEDPDDTID